MTYSTDIGAKVIIQAARFVGLTEVRSNAVWDDLSTEGHDVLADELQAELLRVGWQRGWPYCAAFCEVAWRRAYQGRPELAKVKQMLTPGCLQTWENGVHERWNSQEPQVGAIGIMRNGDSPRGHAFIVRAVKGTTLYTIEANTSPAPGTVEADREGDGVYAKKRELVYKPSSGLHLIGFILPCIES